MGSPTIAVAIATAGRPETVSGVVQRLAYQSYHADFIAICPAKPQDVDKEALAATGLPLSYAEGPVGLCAQRNKLLSHLGKADIVLFIDDDFLMAPDYLEECVEFFQQHPDAVMMTGHVIADGILGPGFSFMEAEKALERDIEPTESKAEEVYNGYGCNMAVRMAPIRSAGLQFDENLPFYGWLEDVDFSRRLAAHGRIMRWNYCRGVHMGVKRGRSPGKRLGYSQIANPVYMWRKGTLTARRALAQMGRNIAANLGKVLTPEPWVDRSGRALGNLLAIRDLIQGRITPQKAAELN